MKKTTVVIPNWNGMKFLKTCMDSLRTQDTDDFEILVIDNASEDGSVEFLRREYPEARVEVMEKNLGFSGGVNEGIRLSETPYVLLLNNDVEAEPGFVRELTESIERYPRAFSVSSKMVRFAERELLDDCGDIYTLLGWQAQRGTGQRTDDPKYNKPCKVFSACAGAAIYRKEVFEEIGLFDLDHFAYLEDIDVGYRAKIYGYENRYEPKAVVYHIGSGTSGAVQYSDFKVKLSARNSIYLINKNMPALQRGLNALPLWIGRKIKAKFFEKRGFKAAYEEGLKEGRANKNNVRKVPFSMKHLGHYISIEGLLIKYLFVYVFEYLKRHQGETKGSKS